MSATKRLVTEMDLEAVLRELHDENFFEPQPGEFTTADYARINKLTQATAYEQLRKLFESDKLARRRGNGCWYWKKAEPAKT